MQCYLYLFICFFDVIFCIYLDIDLFIFLDVDLFINLLDVVLFIFI
jgi:hypothetical protein